MAKKKTGKLPKRIGGVKVPKELRRKGERLLASAQSPEGREAIAAGLTMVAAVAATTLRAKPDQDSETVTLSAGPRPPGVGGTTRVPEFDALAASAVGALQRWLAGQRRN